MKRFSLLCAIILTAFSANAEIKFGSPVFGDNDELLFSAETAAPGFGGYSCLFRIDLDERKTEQLTVFPEEAVMLNNGRSLQIRNRFGLFRTNEDFSGLENVKTFPGFVEGREIKAGKMYPSHSSPDGRYLAYLRPVSAGFGELVLYDSVIDEEKTVSKSMELSYDSDIVRWSPDSSFFIYGKTGQLYYYSIDQLVKGKVLAEEFRVVGDGYISCVRWSAGNTLFYLSDSIIYRILSSQLFTSSLYNGIMELGQVAGKIPFSFDPAFDSFFVSPDGTKIIFNKAGSNIFLYFLKNSDYVSTGEVVSLPYLYLPRNTRLQKIIWPDNDVVTMLMSRIEGGEQKSSLFRFDMRRTDQQLVFKEIPDPGVTDIELSLDGSSVAVLFADRIAIKDYSTWSLSETIKYDTPLNVFWLTDSSLLVAGSYSTEVRNLVTDESRILAVSQADASGFTADGKAYASTNGNIFILDNEKGWHRVYTLDEKAPVVVSDKYRVYTQPLSSGPYANMIMLRRLDSFGTEPLYPYPETAYEHFPVREEPSDSRNFSHGSRIRRREVSIVFNAIDSAEGLTEVLNLLDYYDIKATFFVNGEFMRRNPEAVQELSLSPHEIGSLFFAYFNMTDSRFNLDKEFIKSGLARNEDEYYALTGKELALLWHAPYYVVSSGIIEASGEMNYTYVNRDVDPLEWTAGIRNYGVESPAVPQMIEKIMAEKKPGSIIPVELGSRNGTGSLFGSLELLLNNLLEKGYSVVPVSTLIDRASF